VCGQNVVLRGRVLKNKTLKKTPEHQGLSEDGGTPVILGLVWEKKNVREERKERKGQPIGWRERKNQKRDSQEEGEAK